MSFSPPVNIVVFLSFCIFILFLLGVHHLLITYQQNGCEMTFMYQYSQFVEISLPQEVQKNYPRYALYGYGEGSITEKLRKMKFKGIPVLFIPGSSGSYKQGRSLASVSLRKSLNSRTPFHFNYFLVDFNQELSGVFGGVLEDETKFVVHCIKKILSLYKNNTERQKPESVILIGHSFAGLLTKGVLLDPDLDPLTVRLIISLSTPHKYPVLQTDYYIKNYYSSIAKYWNNNPNLKHISFISVGGGPSDFLVRPDVVTDSNADINVLTTAVPGVWLSNDHLSIMWCKQFVLAIIRALFDSVDLTTKQLNTDKDIVNSVFHYHLVKRNAGKRYSTSLSTRYSTFDKNAKWIENLQRKFTINEPNGLISSQFIMIRLFSDPKNEAAFIVTYNVNVKDWLYVCSADLVHNSVRICESGENLSNLTEIAPVNPSLRLKRKFVYLNLHELKAKGFSHVLVHLPQLDIPMSVNVDVHQPSERNIVYEVSKFYSTYTKVVIPSTETNAGYYSIYMVGFEYLWQSYVLKVETLSCKSIKNHAVVSLILPWANEDQHFILPDNHQLTTTLVLVTPKPRNFNSSLFPTIRFHLDPTCQYRMSLRFSIVGMFSQGARYYFAFLPSFATAVAILTLRQQLKHLDEKKCILYHSALSTAVRRYYIILQATVLGSKVLGLGLFVKFLPVPDFLLLQELNIDSFFLTILSFAVATVSIYSLGAGVYVAIIISGQAAHKMALRFVAKAISGIFNCSEWVLSILHQVPTIVVSILISLSFSVCGAVSIYLGTFFYFLKICKMYEEYLENWFNFSIKLIAKKVKDVVTGKKKNTTQSISDDKEKKEEEGRASVEKERGNKDTEIEKTEQAQTLLERSAPQIVGEIEETDLLPAIHFHVTVFLIWVLLCLLYIPSILVWSRNYYFNIHLEKDPALIPSILVSLCGGVLWQSDTPTPCKKLNKFSSVTLFLLAAISIIYATFSVYRLGYIISASLTVVTLHQVSVKYLE